MKIKKIIFILMIIIFIGTISAYAESEKNDEVQFETVKAKVVEENGQELVEKDGETKSKQKLKIRILEGEYKNEEYEMEYILSEDVDDVSSNLELKTEDSILVKVGEKEGEIVEVNYQKTIIKNNNIYVYILFFICIFLSFIIGRKKAIIPTILYILCILATAFLIILSVKNGWNLILVSAIVSIVTTIVLLLIINGFDKKTICLIIYSMLSIVISGILMYILYDFIGGTDINIKLIENNVNVRELFSGVMMLIGSGVFNIITLVILKIGNLENERYKTKSDNIIEGQRTLKL